MGFSFSPYSKISVGSCQCSVTFISIFGYLIPSFIVCMQLNTHLYTLKNTTLVLQFKLCLCLMNGESNNFPSLKHPFFCLQVNSTISGPIQEVSDNNCVYRNEVHHTAGERTQVLQDVASDPTLPRTKTVRCNACGHGEAVFFQVFFLFCDMNMS